MESISSLMKENNYFYLSFFYSPNSSKRYFEIGELKFCLDNNSAQEAEFSSSLDVCELIKQCLHVKQITSEKPYLLIINPKSGTQMGQKIYDGCISILFQRCNIKYELLKTVRPLHARDYVKSCDCLRNYRGIITVSGDGLIYEVFCGLLDRDSWQEDLELIPVSVIPAGSGNGLAASISSFSGVRPEGKIILYDTLLLTQPTIQTLDLMRVQTSTGLIFPSFLSLTWGLIANVDVGSDRFRWIGSTRFTLSAVVQVAKMNRFKGKLWYLPSYSCNDTFGTSQNVLQDKECSNGNETRNKTFANMPFRYLPDISEPIPSEDSKWILMDQSFITVIASLLPYLATNANVAPSAQINDGKIHIVTINPEISRSELASSISKLECGGHFNNKAVGYLECVAFRLEPDCDDCYMAIDGEVLGTCSVQAEVMPSAARTFTGPYANGETVLL